MKRRLNVWGRPFFGPPEIALLGYLGCVFLLVEPYANLIRVVAVGPLDKVGYSANFIETVEAVSAQVPFLVAILPYHWWLRVRATRAEALKDASVQLLKLEGAKGALADATKYLVALSEAIEASKKKETQITAELEALKAFATDSTDELSKKLRAISLATAPQELKRTFIAFFLGVLSSLLASAIWRIFS